MRICRAGVNKKRDGLDDETNGVEDRLSPGGDGCLWSSGSVRLQRHRHPCATVLTHERPSSRLDRLERLDRLDLTPASSVSTASTDPPGSSVVTSTTTGRMTGVVTVLEIGDSLGEDLGIGMENALAASPQVHLEADAVGDTGLSNQGYYNWPVHLESELQEYHPQVVVIMLGGNDMQGFVNGTAIESVGTAGWKAAYTARVGEMLDEATAAAAKVVWVGMPIMESPSFSGEMAELNSIYQSQVKGHEGATYFASWSLFANSAGQYVGTKPGPNGETLVLHDPDGIHLDGDGCNLLGRAVVAELTKLYGIEVRGH